MTKFNPHAKEILSIGEALDPAMAITEQEDADQYFKHYVEYLRYWDEKDPNLQGKTPEEIARHNLGYFAAYYTHDVRVRVAQLFGAKHPLFNI